MNWEVTKAEYLDGYQIKVWFQDGSVKVVNLEGELWGEIFEPLKDISLFKQFTLSEEWATLCWPNGADIAPEFLYEQGQDIVDV